MNKPTDDEIDVMVAAYLGDCGPQATRVYSFARAVLAKWGTTAPVGVEPVAWAATSEDGDVEALGMNQSRRFDTPLYTADQVLAMWRVPLTEYQIHEAIKAFKDSENLMGVNHIHVARAIERAHGVAAQQGDSHE